MQRPAGVRARQAEIPGKWSEAEGGGRRPGGKGASERAGGGSRWASSKTPVGAVPARRGAALRAPAQLQLPRVQLLRYIQPSVTAPNTVPTRQRLTEPLLSPVLPLIGTSEQPVP